MSPVRQATHVLSAFLEADGSITMIVLFPDTDQAIMTTLDPIETTIRAAGPVPRRIDLTYGAPAHSPPAPDRRDACRRPRYERELDQAARTLRSDQPRQIRRPNRS